MHKIGKYEVIRKLGEGATSSVYLARDPFAAREVAIKLVSQHPLDDPRTSSALRHLFLTEASLAGRLSHPHIAEIYDAVADADLVYIVMEYVGGGTLQQHTRGDRLLAPDDVLEIMYKCARALDFALRLGLIHRDLKPENILVRAGTDIKISDFGSAAMLTSARTVLERSGTPAYMSPEQHLNEPVSCQTDIYALGVVMFQLLTGRLPFQAPNIAALAHQVLNCEPPPPSRFRGDLPEAVDRILLRALQRRCADRYRAWPEFSDDLAAVASAEPLPGSRVLETEKFNALRALDFFRPFGDVELWEALRLGDWQAGAAGAMILREGAPADTCCVLVSGTALVVCGGRTLAALQAGECFGDMAYLRRDSLRTADVVAATDVRILAIPVHALEAASEACRLRFERAFLKSLSYRLARAGVRLPGA